MNPPRIVNAEGFAQFWASFPNRTGKLAAIRVWNTLNVDADFLRQILIAVEDYKRTKPAWKEWCMPRTWLHQGRFLDEAPEPKLQPSRIGGGRVCPHTPVCRSFAACRALLFGDAREA